MSGYYAMRGRKNPAFEAVRRKLTAKQKSKLASYRKRQQLRQAQQGYGRIGGLYGRYRGGPDPEQKFFDTALAFAFPLVGACSTTNATGNIHIIPQDDTSSGREGRQVIINSIQLKGAFQLQPGAAAVASETVWLYLIMDTQCNGANPAITDVFTSNAFISNQVNLANSNRFKIIKKWNYSLNATAGVTTAYNDYHIKLNYYKKCRIPIIWDATAATGSVATTRSNNIFLAFGAFSVGGLVNFDGAARVRYVG